MPKEIGARITIQHRQTIVSNDIRLKHQILEWTAQHSEKSMSSQSIKSIQVLLPVNSSMPYLLSLILYSVLLGQTSEQLDSNATLKKAAGDIEFLEHWL